MTTNIDPKSFVITRKRKKYKFALFANSPLCIEADEWKRQSADVVELGAGTGLFSVELATKYPYKKYIAIDVKADRLQKGARIAEERGLENIFFVRARADQLSDIVPKHSLESLWLTFPDPFPKKRAVERRMMHQRFLKVYEKLLKPDGVLYLKHDNREFFQWSLENLVIEKWRIEELSFDLHDSGLSDDFKILTTYESRWLDEGLQINFVRTTPPKPTK